MIALNKFNINNFQFILLAILPLAFVIGPLIVELLVNTLIIIFIYNFFKGKKFDLIKNKIFIFLFLFYFVLLLSHFHSNYFDETKVNVFFYFRFILFPFAVYEVLKKNKNYIKYLFIILLFTVFIVSFDGLIQYFFEKNLIGYEKYRVDRISGFFREDLILGSYLSRILPLLIGLSIYFKDKKKINKFSFLIINLCILIIFLSGERAPFIKTLIGLVIIFLIVNINLRTKFLYFLFIIIAIFSVISSNPIIFDRYVNQFKYHLFSNDPPPNNKITFMRYYYPMFQTSIKMFRDSKILGKGPKTYRYHCNDPEFITFYPTTRTIDNTVLKIIIPWKQKGDIQISEFFFSENDIIKKNDKLFSYNFVGKDKKQIYFSDKEGIIKKINKKDKYLRNEVLFKLEPQQSPNEEIQKISACNTHPHNFYFQLLAETGFIGFIYVLSIFLFISFLLIKNFIFYIINSSKKVSDSELCILVGFFLVLWPLTTNGNFFNNWINLMNFYPLGIYFFLKNDENINGNDNL